MLYEPPRSALSLVPLSPLAGDARRIISEGDPEEQKHWMVEATIALQTASVAARHAVEEASDIASFALDEASKSQAQLEHESPRRIAAEQRVEQLTKDLDAERRALQPPRVGPRWLEALRVLVKRKGMRDE